MVLRKSPAQRAANQRATQATTTQRRAGGTNASARTAASASVARLEEDTDEFKHDTVNKSLSKAITQARLAKKLNQKQLGQMINEKPQVIQQYESGKAIPNQQIIGKLERALGCKLRERKKKGGKK